MKAPGKFHPPQQLQHEKQQMHERLLVLAPRKQQHGTIKDKTRATLPTSTLP